MLDYLPLAYHLLGNNDRIRQLRNSINFSLGTVSMLGFGKRNKKRPQQTAAEEEQQSEHKEQAADVAPSTAPAEEKESLQDSPSQLQAEPESNSAASSESGGFFSRIRKGLDKTRSGFTEGLGNLLLGEKIIDDEILEEIEMQLIMADVGMEATRTIIENLTAQISRRQLLNSNALYKALRLEMEQLLQPREQPLQIDASKSPFVIFVVGVNGVGKTTTIGKIAKRLSAEGKNVMLAAGDTFRAAAVEQLQVWGERNDIPVIAQHTGADSASVIYDAMQAAQARNVDVLIADTAGRLHTKSNLMEELKKVKRVLTKLDAEAPHETLLVVDAGTGQNAINQAEQFDDAIGVTGIALTKLDGTAKGGIVFAIAEKMAIPLRFIGVGEQIEDLRPFNAQQFVAALFD